MMPESDNRPALSSTTAAGYTCFTCGCRVPSGANHFCPYQIQPYPNAPLQVLWPLPTPKCGICGCLLLAGHGHVCIISQKTPHKCPVCEGRGKVPGPRGGAFDPAECPACKGACVLWGL